MTPCVRCQREIAADLRVCSFCGSLQPLSSRVRTTLTQGSVVERGYGRYVVDHELGSGAMGTVYRAWLFYDPRGPKGADPAELYAIKVLRTGGSQHDGEVRTFFLAEAEALRLLDHPNVTHFRELFEIGTTLALSMEFVDGDTIEAVLQRHAARAKGTDRSPGIEPARAWFYFQQLLGALAATHQLGIVHRDVKPSNVLIRRDGVVKLTDYGIAEIARNQTGAPEPDTNKLVPGTGPYMSPEQVQGLKLDGRSDLYSAAIVFYEMLTGRLPFDVEGKSEWLVRLGHLQDAPHPLGTFLSGASDALEQVFARAFAKRPEYRQPDALTLGEELRLALGMPDAPEWRAYAELAQEAARFRGHTAALSAASSPKMKTLRALVLNKLRTAPMAIAGPLTR